MDEAILSVYAAYDRALIGEVPLCSAQDAADALDRAEAVFADPVKRIPAHERKAILRRTIDIMQSREQQFLRDAAAEGGKPLVDTRVEFSRALSGIEVAIEQLGHLSGTEIPMNLNPASLNRMAFTFREPGGIVVALSAFNHPINLIVHQVIPAVATGCPVIVKPASSTPLSCINVVQALYDAGLPEDWARMLTCDHAAADLLVTDPRVNYLSFIGSAEVGWELKSRLAPGATCALEHGGVAPVVMEPDADIASAVPLIAKGGFYHAGQVCVSVQRLYAHESICREVASQLARAAAALKVGDPLDEATEVGPLIEPAEVDRVERWVKEALSAGAGHLAGGKRISDTCFEPTVLLNPPDDVIISQHEAFGPVVCVYSYKTRDEAIQRANALPYSFQAAVFTQDIDAALDCVQRLKARAVMVNDHTAFRVDWMPFGGREQSGMGTGGIPYTMHEMTTEKLMVLRHKPPRQ